MLTAREAFKVGFMLKCAEAGLSKAEIAACMAKAAGMWSDAASAASSVGNAVGTAGIAAPILLGGGLGYLAHRAATPDVDEGELKTQELIEEFKHYARRAKEHQRAKAMRALGG
jgi:hypothetical protein